MQEYFNIERKRHTEFFLPFYQEKNWQVVQDNIDSNHKNDWDVKLKVFAGQYVLVDEKALLGNFDNFLIEIIQDMKTGNLGWYFSKKDWILYGIWDTAESIEPAKLYLIKSDKLKEYINSLEGFIKICISKKGWGNTWNLVLEWNDLINEGVAKKLL